MLKLLLPNQRPRLPVLEECTAVLSQFFSAALTEGRIFKRTLLPTQISMKRIFIFALLLTAGFTVAHTAVRAQQAAAASQVEPKVLFASRVNEVDAHLSRSRPEEARRAFNELAGMMQTFIAESKNTKASTLYTETKILSVDMVKNHTDLVAKLRQFLDLM